MTINYILILTSYYVLHEGFEIKVFNSSRLRRERERGDALQINTLLDICAKVNITNSTRDFELRSPIPRYETLMTHPYKTFIKYCKKNIIHIRRILLMFICLISPDKSSVCKISVVEISGKFLF